MKAFALAAGLSLVLALPAVAASPVGTETQPVKPLAPLWKKYPLGHQKLKPLAPDAPPQRTRPAPVPASPAPKHAPARPKTTVPESGTGGGGGSSFPLWTVLLGALGLSCVLGLAGESIVRRVRHLIHPPRPYEATFAKADTVPEEAPAVVPALEDDGSIAASVELLRVAVAGLGREDVKLQAVVEAVSSGGEWRALSLATALASWDEPRVVPLARARSRLAQSEGGKRMEDGYADLGNRVAAVLHAAEEVATRIREEARQEAARIRREAEDAANSRVEHLTREAEQLHTKAEKALADAESQSRRRSEEAEENAARIEAEALKHQENLHEAARSLEERLQQTLVGLEHVSTTAESVLAPPEGTATGNGSSEALSA